MKPSRPTTLLAVAAGGLVVGWLLDAALAAMGEPVIVPPYSLAAVLVFIALVVVAAAVPVRRAVKDATARVDPFYAMRVVVLAKATALSGAVLAGWALGVLLYLLSRSVVPGVGSVLMAAASVAGAVALLVGGLVAERMCTVPPDDDEGPTGATAA